MRSAARSIPSDIAEGRGRHSTRDYRHFVYQARGSTHEVETQIEMARRQQFIGEERAIELMKLANEVGRLISGLIRNASKRLMLDPDDEVTPDT